MISKKKNRKRRRSNTLRDLLRRKSAVSAELLNSYKEAKESIYKGLKKQDSVLEALTALKETEKSAAPRVQPYHRCQEHLAIIAFAKSQRVNLAKRHGRAASVVSHQS